MAALAGLVLIFFSQSGGAAPNLPSCKATWAHLIAQGGHRFQPTQDKKYSDYLARIHRVDCQKDWTLLVYMAANNDLAPYALWDLYEMEAAFKDPDLAGSGLATDLVVQLEHASENKIQESRGF
jgi:hypothetical protein